MPHEQVNDIAMYYEALGDGEPIVLIPGLGTDITEYKPIIEGLARTNRVIAVDNRGAGRTDKPRSAYSIEMMADDVAALLQKIGIQQANILGISMGGRIAQALALKHPEMVKRLLLVSTSSRLIHRRRIGLFGLARRLPIARSKHPQPNHAFKLQRQATASFDNSKQLHNLHMPTLILHGRKDGITPLRLAEELQQGITGSKLIVFNGGHLFLFMSEQKSLIAEIESFVNNPKE